MALVCPVGHPPGVGTPYCRLCGRDYVETADAPVLVAAVGAPVGGPAAGPVPPPAPPTAPPVEPPTQVLPVVGAVLPPEPPTAPPGVDVPADELHSAGAPVDDVSGAELPVVELPVQPGPRHAADALSADHDAEPPAEPADDHPVTAMVERRLVAVMAAATFVGGLVVGGGAVAFLG